MTPQKITRITLAPRAEFGTTGSSASTGVLLLSSAFTQKLPLPHGDDKGLWPWYFQSQLESVFGAVKVVGSLDEARQLDGVRAVVKPELWLYYHTGVGGVWECLLEFRYRILDPQGRQLDVVTASGRGYREGTASMKPYDALTTFATAINQVTKELQASLRKRTSMFE